MGGTSKWTMKHLQTGDSHDYAGVYFSATMISVINIISHAADGGFWSLHTTLKSS